MTLKISILQRGYLKHSRQHALIVINDNCKYDIPQGFYLEKAVVSFLSEERLREDKTILPLSCSH